MRLLPRSASVAAALLSAGALGAQEHRRILLHLRHANGTAVALDGVEGARRAAPLRASGGEDGALAAALPDGAHGCPLSACHRIAYRRNPDGPLLPPVSPSRGAVADPWLAPPEEGDCHGPPPRAERDGPRRSLGRRLASWFDEYSAGPAPPKQPPALFFDGPQWRVPVYVPWDATELVVVSPRPCAPVPPSGPHPGGHCATRFALPPPPVPRGAAALADGRQYAAVPDAQCPSGTAILKYSECDAAAGALGLSAPGSSRLVDVAAKMGTFQVDISHDLMVTYVNETGPCGIMGVRNDWRLARFNGKPVATTRDIQVDYGLDKQVMTFAPPRAMVGSWPGRPSGCYAAGGTVYWNPSGFQGQAQAARDAVRGGVQWDSVLCYADESQVPNATLCKGHEKVEIKTLQRVGPDEDHYNLVFVSAGYQKHQASLYMHDVEEAVKLLQYPPVEGFRKSVPHSRMFPLFNVHAIYEESEAQGANPGNNIDCGTIPGIAQALKCNIYLAMEVSACAPCGSRGKRNVITVVFINDERYGGTATRQDGGDYLKVGVFSTRWWTSHPRDKRQFASLFFHELAHAWFFLWDEYDIAARTGGYAPNNLYPYPIPNCGPETEFSSPPWRDWLRDDRASDRYRALDSVPHKPCGVYQYGKPSRDCMLEKLDSERMCPVCREKGLIEIYKLGGQRPTETRRDPVAIHSITNPTCPLTDSVVIVEHEGAHPSSIPSSVVLYGNDRFLELDDIHVSWSVTPPVPGMRLSAEHETFLVVSAKDLAPGTLYTFTMRVEDRTDWIKRDADVEGWWRVFSEKWPDRLAGIVDGCDAMMKQGVRPDCDRPTIFNARDLEQWLQQEAKFKVYAGPPPADDPLWDRYQQALGSVPLALDGSSFHFDVRADHPGAYAVIACENAAGCDCSVRSVHAPYEVPHDYGADLAVIAEKEDMVIGACVAGLLVVSKLIASWASSRYGARAPPIVVSDDWFEYAEWYRRLIFGSHTLLVLLGLTVVGAGAACASRLDSMQVLIIYGFMIVAYSLVVISSIGLLAAWYRIKRLLALILVVEGATMLPVSVALGMLCAYRITEGDPDHSVQRLGETLWIRRVESAPQGTCTLQRRFLCSGWWQNCSWTHDREDCPEYCEGTNYWYGRPCSEALQEHFNKYFPAIVGMSCAVWALGLLVTVTTALFIRAQRHVRQQQKLNREKEKVLRKEGSQLVAEIRELREAKDRDSRIGGAVLRTLEIFMPQKQEPDTRPRKWAYSDITLGCFSCSCAITSLFTEWSALDGTLLDMRARGDHLQGLAALYALGGMIIFYGPVVCGVVYLLMYGRGRFTGAWVRFTRKMLKPVTMAAIAVLVTAALTTVVNNDRHNQDCEREHMSQMQGFAEFGEGGSGKQPFSSLYCDYPGRAGLPFAVLGALACLAHSALHAMQDPSYSQLGNKNLDPAPTRDARTCINRSSLRLKIEDGTMVVKTLSGRTLSESYGDPGKFVGWALAKVDGRIVVTRDEATELIAEGSSPEVVLEFHRLARPLWWAPTNYLLCEAAAVCLILALVSPWASITTVPQHVDASNASAKEVPKETLVTLGTMGSGVCPADFTGAPELLASLHHAGVAPGLQMTGVSCESYFFAIIETILLGLTIAVLQLWSVFVTVLSLGARGGWYVSRKDCCGQCRRLTYERAWTTLARFFPQPSGITALGAMFVPILFLGDFESHVQDSCQDSHGTVYCVAKWGAGPEWCVVGGLLAWLHWWVHDFQDRGVRQATAESEVRRLRNERSPLRPKVELLKGVIGFAPEQLLSLFEAWVRVDIDREGMAQWDFRQFWNSALWMDLEEAEVQEMFDYFAVDDAGRLQWHELEAALEDGALALDDDGQIKLRRLSAKGFARLEQGRGAGAAASPFDLQPLQPSNDARRGSRVDVLDALLDERAPTNASVVPDEERNEMLDALLDTTVAALPSGGLGSHAPAASRRGSVATDATLLPNNTGLSNILDRPVAAADGLQKPGSFRRPPPRLPSQGVVSPPRGSFSPRSAQMPPTGSFSPRMSFPANQGARRPSVGEGSPLAAAHQRSSFRGSFSPRTGTDASPVPPGRAPATQAQALVHTPARGRTVTAVSQTPPRRKPRAGPTSPDGALPAESDATMPRGADSPRPGTARAAPAVADLDDNFI
eukprot:TRINITY_DN20321_c0_g1_i1.p1 TRINITY_DN20321_c0_g1~~TRINITY_DN20321_c0_g1_i1.p1  ORF type:complete len:2147 (+),score=578.94 TRINITY_DN20321_c0_g1_i1:79-6519(+)